MWTALNERTHSFRRKPVNTDFRTTGPRVLWRHKKTSPNPPWSSGSLVKISDDRIRKVSDEQAIIRAWSSREIEIISLTQL